MEIRVKDVEESKSRKEGIRVETATFGPFDFSTPTVHSSKDLRRKQNFEAFVVRMDTDIHRDPSTLNRESRVFSFHFNPC